MRSNSGLKGSNVGLVRVVDLMFASFVTSSSTLMGVATRRADDEERRVVEGAKANTADEEQSAVTTATEENCMLVCNNIIQDLTGLSALWIL
jgi:hypothetical protein